MFIRLQNDDYDILVREEDISYLEKDVISGKVTIHFFEGCGVKFRWFIVNNLTFKQLESILNTSGTAMGILSTEKIALQNTNPVPMIIFCPQCHTQHIDKDEWVTRPHSKHLCDTCGIRFDIASDINTVGVEKL